MADNYLENHYEDYEKRKAAWLKARKLGKLPKSRKHTTSTTTPSNGVGK